MTIANLAGRLLPRPLRKFLQPKWHKVRDYLLFRIRLQGRLRFDKSIGDWVAVRPFAGRKLAVPVRSYRQFRRYYQFGRQGDKDVVFAWMRRIEDCEVLYDIGSSNGLEGFFTNHLWGSKIVFVEPFTPSIETILKTIVLQGPAKRDDFEVVQSGCDLELSQSKLYMHHGPIPGANRNSVAKPENYDRGGRQSQPVLCHQWVMTVSLDSLHWDLGLSLPTHVKIDVDGFEDQVMAGATKLLREKCVHSWAIELNGLDNKKSITALMATAGYDAVAEWEHYPGSEYYSGDTIFVRSDITDAYRQQAATAARSL